MPNKPNPHIIDEADFLRSLENGDVQEIEKPPVVAGTPSGPMAPPSLPPQTIPTLSGSLPASMQFPTDLIRTQMPGVPSQRLWPIAPAGTPGIASAVTSGTRGISVVANQANKTATSANTTAKTASAAVTVVSSTPVMQVDSGGSVVQAPVGSIGAGGGILTPTLDNLGNGSTYGRVKQTELTSGTVHQLNNGTDVRTVTAAAGAFDTSGNVTLKNVASASGNPGTPDTTNSTSFIRMLNMVITVVNKGNPVLITFNGALSNNTAGHNTVYALFRDGSQLSGSMTLSTPTANGIYPACLIFMDVPSAASHTYEIKWLCASGSIATAEVGYQMQLIELG